MNILFYLHRYPAYGGIENVTTILSNWLVSKVDSITIFSFYNMDEDMLLGKLDSRINFIKADESEDFNSAANVSKLRNVLLECKIDVVIFQDSYATIENGLFQAMVKLPIKLFVVEHNSPICFLNEFKYNGGQSFWEILKKRLFYPYLYFKILHLIRIRHRKLYNRCDKYILLSKNFVPLFEKLVSNSDFQKLAYINNPITIAQPTKINTSKEKVCLFCGRLVSQKGITYLMKIWQLIESRDSDWKLIIVGDGPERDYVEKFIHNHHLKRVKLEGFQLDVIKYYNKASILTMTSVYEGWLLSLGESMTYGCVPILFNSYASAVDIIDDGNTGMLVQPFEVTEYAEKLLGLMNDHKKLQQMSCNAQMASKKFGIADIGQQWINLLKKQIDAQ